MAVDGMGLRRLMLGLALVALLGVADASADSMRPHSLGFTMSGSASEREHPPAHAFDSDPKTHWRAASDAPSWLELHFAGIVRIARLDVVWNEGEAASPFALEASVDGKTWRPVPVHDAIGSRFRVTFQRRGVAVAELQTSHGQPSKADLVNVFMGTNNDGPAYSRGNQYPAIHVPFGMAAWSVGSAGLQDPWFYDHDDAALTGIKLTHQPTVWGGDFGSFDLMPMTGSPSADYRARSSAYRRASEIARPYYYRNVLDRYGVTFEFVPSERGAIFRFEFPEQSAPFLVFGGAGAQSVFQQDAHAIAGRFLNGGIETFFHAEFDRPMRAFSRTAAIAGALEFEAGAIVTMRIATSYVSGEQAAHNLALELGRHSLQSLREETKERWEEALGRIEVEGGSPADAMTFYSALYRMLAFPKAHWEPVGNDTAATQYRSPFDGQVHRGKKLWAGNGFWDTYRGVWPLMTLLFPTLTGEMLDGFVNSYREGGWSVRWSKPGYWECMIGTHTDVVFADAYLKGIRNWDYETGYEASLKNALVPAGYHGKGRRFLDRSAFLGYVPWTGLFPDDEVGARTLEDAVNDFGISQFAKALGKEGDHAYFRNRALSYVNLWSPSVRHFRGKDASGAWRSPDADFDPFAWRYEWTEGNAWHYRAAPMHDGAGLAALMGGRRELERALDEVLQAPPHFVPGGYGIVIHEMLEAQRAGELGFGQLALGNEPAQHLLHMYAHAGRPSKTQYWVRRALRQLFEPGYANGHGYPGDEDNGQMSAWFVMNAMGFYSATPGQAEYVLASPLFDAVTLRLEDGRRFRIETDGNSEGRPYISGASLNGAAYEHPYLRHDSIVRGGILRLAMSDKPTDWGEVAENMPSSLTPLGSAPQYRPDLALAASVTGNSGGNESGEGLAQLVDGDSNTKWLSLEATSEVTLRLPQPQAVDTYSLTSAADAPERDPRAWRLYGSDDGQDWRLLDERSAVAFSSRRQTQPFYLNSPAPYAWYRFEFLGTAGAAELQLAEIELRQLRSPAGRKPLR